MSDYAALRALLAEEPYAGMDDAAAAVALNAATVERPRRFRWREARRLAQMARRWPMVLVRARQTPSLPPATEQDFAILAAINATSMDDDQEIDPANTGEWAAFSAGLSALTASGDLSEVVADAIRALGVEMVTPAQSVGWGILSEMTPESAALTVAAARAG